MIISQNKFTSKKVLLLIFSLSIALQGCAVNVYNWKGIPDEEVIQRSSEKEKIEQYKKYAIEDIKATSKGHYIGFSTLEQPNKVYDLYSYSPILLEYSPQSETYFQSALNWESAQMYTTYGYIATFSIYSMIATPSILAPMISADTRQQNYLNYVVFYAASTLAYLGFYWFFHNSKMKQYELIKDDFNENLRKRLQIEEFSAAPYISR